MLALQRTRCDYYVTNNKDTPMAWAKFSSKKVRIIDATFSVDGGKSEESKVLSFPYFHREDMNLVRNQKRGIKGIVVLNVEIYSKNKDEKTSPDNTVERTQMAVATAPNAEFTANGVTMKDLLLEEGAKVAIECPIWRDDVGGKEKEL